MSEENKDNNQIKLSPEQLEIAGMVHKVFAVDEDGRRLLNLLDRLTLYRSSVGNDFNAYETMFRAGEQNFVLSLHKNIDIYNSYMMQHAKKLNDEKVKEMSEPKKGDK